MIGGLYVAGNEYGTGYCGVGLYGTVLVFILGCEHCFPKNFFSKFFQNFSAILWGWKSFKRLWWS